MSAARRRPRRLRLPRAEWLIAATGILFLAFLAWLAVQVVSQSQHLRSQGQDLLDERAYSRALAQQVEDLGGTPVPGSSGSPGQPGERGEKGDKGDKGEPGKPAPTITPSSGASGASGAPGRPGADSTVPGPSGSPGADSTVPGPSGEPGRDGVDGRDGTDGVDGEDGKPPASWTWTDRFGDTYTCRPVADFDPENPRYECPRDEQQPDEPGNGNGGLLSAGLDPSRRQYM